MGARKSFIQARSSNQLWHLFAGTALFAVLLFGFAGAVFAQESTATVTGTVTDPKGLAMSGATVLVHSEDTGVDQKPVTTTDAGTYVVPLLPPGTYDVTASQTGFATVQHKGITLQVGQTVRVDVDMPVAAQQSLVTVTTEVPILETEKTEQSQNVSESMVSNLPVSSRRWEQFAFLTPGVTPDGTTGAISFHGLNSLYNNNSVDGANNNSSYNGAARGGSGSDGYVYSGDSIREFQVETSSFNAELGQAAGGAVNAVTKSGTSQYHGDLFYNGRSPDFNAYDPVSKFTAAQNHTVPSIPVRQQNQWGGSLGGPIIKDKLFFFVTEDGYRKVNPLSTTTAQMNPTIGSFVCPTVASFSPAQQLAVNNECALAKNFVLTDIVGSFPRTLQQDIGLVKLDYQINQSNHVSAVANLRDWKQPTSTLSVNGGTSYLQDRFVIATLNTVIGSNKVNEFRYQYGVDNSFSTINNLYGAPSMALSSLFTYGQSGGTGYSNEIRNQVTDNLSITHGAHTIKFGVDINIIQDLQRSSTNSAGAFTYGGVSFGGNITCNNPLAATPNEIFCDWLADELNIPDGSKTGQHWTSFTQIKDVVNASYPQTFAYNIPDDDMAGYIQDTWKARPNLTINYGLRYDAQILPQPPESSSIVFGANSLPLLDYYTDTINNQFDAIQPRVGVAWNVEKNTVLRVGGGVFYAKTPGSTIKTIVSGAGESNVNCSTPVVTTGPTANCPANLIAPDVLFNQQDTTAPTFNGYRPPFPGAVSTAVVNPTVTFPNPKTGIRGIDPNAVRPRAYEAEVAVEHQLPGNLNLSLTYTFTRGVHIPTSFDANTATNYDTQLCTTPATTLGVAQSSCGTYVNKTYYVTDANGNPVQTSGGPLQPVVPLFWNKLNPATGPIITQFTSVNSTYNGLVVTLRKAPSHGLEVLANYTLSKATDDGQGGNNIQGGGTITSEGFVATDGVINPFNQHLEQGPSSTDARNRFTASVVYTPPFAKGLKNRFAKEALDGWAISSAITASNGTHYSGTIGSTASPTLTLTGYAPGSQTAVPFNFTGLDGGMSGADIQTTGNPLGGRATWLGRNSFTLPNLYNVDLRVTKVWSIHERYSIEFRAEAFNLFNSTLVLAVNANAFTYTAAGKAVGTGVCGAPSGGTCMTPVANFGNESTTSGLLMGPRQLQGGLRFNF